MGENVETFCQDGEWMNRIVGREALPGVYRTQQAGVEVGRGEARIRGVDHIIRRADGTVAERNRYPRRSEEIPG